MTRISAETERRTRNRSKTRGRRSGSAKTTSTNESPAAVRPAAAPRANVIAVPGRDGWSRSAGILPPFGNAFLNLPTGGRKPGPVAHVVLGSK